jgi:hypothetical protein
MAPWLLDLAAASLGIVAYLYFAWVLHFRLDLLNRQWARVSGSGLNNGRQTCFP